MNKRLLLKKLYQSIFTIFLVIIINFFLFRVMPGNPLSMHDEKSECITKL